MSTQASATQPPQPISDTLDLAPFELTTAVDIAHTLRQLIARRETVSLYFNRDAQFTLTTILNVDPKLQWMLLDRSGSPDTNRRIVSSERNLFVCAPDGIRHQFVTGPLREGTHDGKPVLTTRLPTSLIKLQRRQFFRLKTPLTHPLKCQIRPTPSSRLECPLTDISVGGLCLVITRQPLNPQIMIRYESCSLDLPGHGVLTFGLEVRHSRSQRQINGQLYTYAGCQFIGMSNSDQKWLQKYITLLQKALLHRPA